MLGKINLKNAENKDYQDEKTPKKNFLRFLVQPIHTDKSCLLPNSLISNLMTSFSFFKRHLESEVEFLNFADVVFLTWLLVCNEQFYVRFYKQDLYQTADSARLELLHNF